MQPSTRPEKDPENGEPAWKMAAFSARTPEEKTAFSAHESAMIQAMAEIVKKIGTDPETDKDMRHLINAVHRIPAVRASFERAKNLSIGTPSDPVLNNAIEMEYQEILAGMNTTS